MDKKSEKELEKLTFTLFSFVMSIFSIQPASSDWQSPFLSFAVYNMKEGKPQVRNKEC